MSNVVYVIGSLRNTVVPEVAEKLRAEGYEVFDDWYSPGPKTDDYWQEYSQYRGLSYREALYGFHAQHVFAFDKHHLDRADIAVLVMPAGKSAHLELGYMAGCGKRTYVLFAKEPDRYDVMYNFANYVCFSVEELITRLREDNCLESFDLTDRR